MSQDNHKSLPVEEIHAYCKTQPIERLYLLPASYDSFLRPDMDIGMLVEYEPEASIGYFELGRHELDLGARISRRVDLHTESEILPEMRRQVNETARLLYER